MRDYRTKPKLLTFHSCVSPFLAWGDFHARSRFARSTIPEEKWGTTCSLSFRFPMPIERAAVWQLYQVTAKGQQEVEFSSPKVKVMFE